MSKPEWKFQTCLNGDRPETLMREFREVLDYAVELETFINYVTLHGRNFQTHSEEERQGAFENDARLKQEMRDAVSKIIEIATAGALRAQAQKGGE